MPSFNLRLGILDRPRLGIALESMAQYLPRRIDLIDGYAYLHVEREGWSWFARLNTTWSPGASWDIHVSAGATYSQTLVLRNDQRAVPRVTERHDLVSPDASVSLAWRSLDWLSLHSTISYGTTFLYLDNVPRKIQVATGFRLAPFWWTDIAILRATRVEAAFLIIHFHDVRETVAGPIGFLYWQGGSLW